MKIDENTAKEVVYNGRPYLVASDDCKDRFDANPAKYVGPASQSQQDQQQHQHKHGCC